MVCVIKIKRGFGVAKMVCLLMEMTNSSKNKTTNWGSLWFYRGLLLALSIGASIISAVIHGWLIHLPSPC